MPLARWCRFGVCQGRNEGEPLERKKREPVGGTIKQGFSGRGFSGLRMGCVCGRFP